MREEIDHTLGQEMDLEIDGQEVCVLTLSCQLCVSNTINRPLGNLDIIAFCVRMQIYTTIVVIFSISIFSKCFSGFVTII